MYSISKNIDISCPLNLWHKVFSISNVGNCLMEKNRYWSRHNQLLKLFYTLKQQGPHCGTRIGIKIKEITL